MGGMVAIARISGQIGSGSDLEMAQVTAERASMYSPAAVPDHLFQLDMKWSQ